MWSKYKQPNQKQDTYRSSSATRMWHATGGLQTSTHKLPPVAFSSFFFGLLVLFVFVFVLLCFSVFFGTFCVLLFSCGEIVGAARPLVLVPSYAVTASLLRLCFAHLLTWHFARLCVELHCHCHSPWPCSTLALNTHSLRQRRAWETQITKETQKNKRKQKQ